MSGDWYITDDCYNKCSDHGLCINSVCYCEEDYTYDDCSLTYDEYKKLGTKPKDLILTWSIIASVGFVLMLAYKLFTQSRGSSADYIKID